MEQKPTPSTPYVANHRRLIAVGAMLLLVAAVVTSVLMMEPKKKVPEPMPTSADIAAGEIETLPLPSSAEIADAYGGLSGNTEQQSLVTRVGNQIIRKSDAAKVAAGTMRFFVVSDENRINVFAMPDGTIFITSLLLNRLKTEAQLAAMLAHEIGQVTARHKPVYRATGEIVYSRDDEIRADANGVRYMSQAGYNPQALIDVLMMMRDVNMEVPVEFFVTHPSPVNRVARIEFAIKQQFPDGVPDSLSK